MAETIHYTRFEVEGPWLVDKDDLDDLQETLDRIRATLERHQSNHIRRQAEKSVRGGDDLVYRRWSGNVEEASSENDRVEDEYKRLYALNAKESKPAVEFVLSDRRKIRAASIREIREHSDIALIPTRAVSIEFESYPHCKIQCNFDVRRGKLDFNCYPADSAIGGECFNILRGWASPRQPPRWQCLWMDSSWMVMPALVFMGLFCLIGWDAVSVSTREIMRPDAATLLKGGSLNESKMPQAVELLLREDFGLPDKPTPPRKFPWNWLLLTVAMCLLFLLGRPRAAIGIGPTLREPGNRRRWLSWVIWVAPSAIFVAYFLPKMVGLFFGESWSY